MNRYTSSENWHKRFQQQATWTHNLRQFIYERAGLADAESILDIGCGTGVLEAELNNLTHARLVGIDINASHLMLAMRKAPETHLTLADGLALPLPDKYFDLSLCHFLLLWVTDPILVLREMVRTTRSGGAVLVLAEPDYGGRVDYPDELTQLGNWQQVALYAQGADPLTGRRLSSFLHQAGLAKIETGVLGGQWEGLADQSDWQGEWEMLENDLTWIDSDQVNSEQLRMLKEKNARAYQSGERVLYVPTFYGWGRVV